MDHFTLNLRPKEYFQMAPDMRTAYIELYTDYGYWAPKSHKYGMVCIMGAEVP